MPAWRFTAPGCSRTCATDDAYRGSYRLTGAIAGSDPAVTLDAFYGGRLLVRQPAKGHRSGTDAVLLAAAVPAKPFELCYDVGAGVGVVGLGVAVLRPGTIVVLVEREAAAAALGQANCDALGMPTPPRLAECDVLDRDALRRALPRRADLVVTNPPFHDAGRSRPSPDPARRAAHMLDATSSLADWFAACLDRLADKGTLVTIVGAPALPETLAALAGAAGGIVAKPVHPRRDAAAHRVLLRAEKGSRKPFGLAAPLILHEANGAFTPEADLLHRGDAVLDW